MAQEFYGESCIAVFLDRIPDPTASFLRPWWKNASAAMLQTFPWIDPDPGERIKQELFFFKTFSVPIVLRPNWIGFRLRQGYGAAGKPGTNQPSLKLRPGRGERL